jgi:ComF family protein
MLDTLDHIMTSVRHLFYPHVCRSCYREVSNREQFICINCLAELPFTDFALSDNNPVEKNFYGRVPIEAAMSLLYFTPASIVQHLIHQVKYKGQEKLAIYLGKMMGRALLSAPRFDGIDLVLPLPLFKNREKQRGYNQSSLLGRGISEVTGIPISEKALKRTKSTATQTRKSREDRWLNVEGLFSLSNPAQLENKSILLVDDVVTTGATLDACSSAILKTKGTKLYICTLAYAMQ